MTTHTSTPCRIYVACLASYSSGILHGTWCDFTTDDIHEQVQAMLRDSKYPNVMVECPACSGTGCTSCADKGEVPSAEEWAIHDSEGFPRGYVQEHSDFDELADMAELIEEQGLELVTAAMDCTSADDAASIRSMIEDNYCGVHDSLADWAEEMCADIYYAEIKGLPGFIKYHIDWAAVAQELLGGDYQEVRINGTHHIFHND